MHGATNGGNLKLLHVMASLDPREGGPIEGVLQMGTFLKAQGHSSEVVTLDAPFAPFLKDLPIVAHALGPSMGKYRFNKRLFGWLRAHAREYDGIIVNGLWQYHGLATWMALRGMGVFYYVFLHGMLDPWFRYAYPMKHLKKWLYWPWAEFWVLRGARFVLCTTEEEMRLARQSFWLYRANEIVVSYGTSAPPGDSAALSADFFAAYPELQGRRILLFLGRVHEKKGCDLLVRAFAEMSVEDSRLHLVIAGPDKSDLLPQLQLVAEKLGICDRISWTGMLQGKMKWGAFYSAEAFVLPSHQENFGIAVVEALGCGLPVLISDKVNIWREIKADNAGFVEDDTLQGTRNLLNAWLRAPSDLKLAMKDNARRLFEKRFTVDAMAKNLTAIVMSHRNG